MRRYPGGGALHAAWRVRRLVLEGMPRGLRAAEDPQGRTAQEIQDGRSEAASLQG
jgi:hypothetical protein